MLVEMKVDSIAVDPATKVPIVLLKDLNEERTLPIWIGLLEAGAIATEIEKQKLSRPMTHDLIKDILGPAEVELFQVVITDLKDNVYYASIYLRSPKGEFTVDSRPSDAIALALRAAAPILVSTTVLEKSGEMAVTERAKPSSDKEEWTGLLEDISPEGFGKYKM